MSLKHLSNSDSVHKPKSAPAHIREPEILALLGRSRCHFQIGAASRWLPNESPAIRRLAEFVRHIVFPSLGEAVARRFATAAISDITQRGGCSPAEIIANAIGRALDLLDEDVAQVRTRLAAISRRRAELAELAALRKRRLNDVRRLEGMIASLRHDIARDELAFRGSKPLLSVVQFGKTRDLPRAERALAAARASLPVSRLGVAARRTRDELKGRLRKLRHCRRALTTAARRIAAEAKRPIVTQDDSHG